MNIQSITQTADEVSAKVRREWLLLSGIKNLLRCDEAEVVQGIARYVISQYRSLRVGSEFVERRKNTPIPCVAAFLGAVTRFLEVPDAERRDGVVWVARLDNERRVIEKLVPLLPEFDWTELKFQRPPERAAVLTLSGKLFPLRRRIFKLVRLLLRRKHEFFKVLRVVEMIGYYVRYLDIFQRGYYSLAVMSSHSNPHGIAFNLAARRCDVPTVLITHGMPVRPVAKLSYDLAVVHCKAARQIYSEDGCQINQAIIHGRRQNYAQMPKNQLAEFLTVGIFLCKDVNEEKLRDLVRQLLGNPRVAHILIRPHPKNLFVEFDAWLASLGDIRVQRSLSDSVFGDLDESDIVLGCNSSVLIEAVTAGRPGGYVSGLDFGSPDLHKLVAGELIYPVNTELSFDFDDMLRFYQRAEWLNILRLFANIDENESSVEERIAVAIRQLFQLRNAGILPGVNALAFKTLRQRLR